MQLNNHCRIVGRLRISSTVVGRHKSAMVMMMLESVFEVAIGVVEVVKRGTNP